MKKTIIIVAFLLLITSCVVNKPSKNIETKTPHNIDSSMKCSGDPGTYTKTPESKLDKDKINIFYRSDNNTEVCVAAIKKLKNNQTKNLIKKKSNNNKIIDPIIKDGRLVYCIPDTMKLKNTYTIVLRINRNINSLKILDSLNKPQIINIKTTNSMDVSIIDPSTDKSFNIVKQNSDRQFIDDSDYTEWIYSVQPLNSGNLKLNIIVSIIKDDNVKQIVYFNTIYVKSNSVIIIKGFWETYWQWLITTFIIPLAIFIYKKSKKEDK